MADTMAAEFTEASSQNKAREVLNGISHYRIDPINIKMADTSPCKTGGEGVVTVGTIELPGKALAGAKRYISVLKMAATMANGSLEDLRSILPRMKEECEHWPHGMPLNLAAEMIAMSPEGLNQWCPKVKVAVKMLKWNRNDYEESAKRFKSFAHELSLMAGLSHPNIIEMTGFVEDMENGDAWIILPWETNGNVRDFLHSGPEWDLAERISLIQDTARGVEYLHSHQPPICHGDLKSLNILVNSCYRAVITDFGSARIKQHVASGERENPSERPRGAVVNDGRAAEGTSPEVKYDPSTSGLTLTGPLYSLRWAAPEVMGGEEQDLPSDMWAIGWIGWEIITGRMPFEELNTQVAIIHHTVRGKLPAIREHADLSHVLSLCALMSECWHLEPWKRIDVSAFQLKVGMIPASTPSGAEPLGAGAQKTRSAALLLEQGQIYELQGDKEKALYHYQAAMDVAIRTKNEEARGHALRHIGHVYRIQSKHNEAEQALMEAQNIYSRADSDRGPASALGGLGHVYRIQAKYHQAEKAFSEVLSCSGDQLQAANALLGLAQTYGSQLKHGEADQAYMDAHEAHSRIGNDMGAAYALGGLGEIYLAQSKHRESEKVYLESHEIHSRIGNREGAAHSLRGLGHTYRAQSRFQEAEKAFNDAYKAHPSGSNLKDAANQIRSLGMLYQDQGRHNEAEVSYRQAFAAYDRADHPTSQALTLLSLGELYHAQARYSDAEEAIAEALAIGVSLDCDHLRASAYFALVRISRSQSKHTEEIESLIQAGESFARIGRHEDHAKILGQLGATHMAQGMYVEAEEYYRHAQAISSSIEEATGEATVLVALGVLYGHQGRHGEAAECFAQARIARAAVADESDAVKALDTLIGLSASLRKPKDAKVALMKACELLSQSGEHALHADTLKHLGDIHVEEGTYVEAEESYRHAQAIFSSLEEAPREADVLDRLGILYVRQGRHDEAEECFAQARVAYAMVADEDREAKALDKLMGVYAMQGKFVDAKVACMEACEMYAQRGQPMSELCAHIRELLQRLEESPLEMLSARPLQS